MRLSEANLPAPIFKTDGIFTVVFERVNTPKSSGKSSGKGVVLNWLNIKESISYKSPIKITASGIKILELIYFSPEITIPEMARKIKITERAIEKNIQKLREQNLLERRDGDRGGFWKILVD